MRLIVLALLCGFCCSFTYAAEKKAFRWSATAAIKAQAPLNEMLPAATYKTTSQSLRLPPSVLGAPFVIAVRDPDCPISRRYAARLRALEADGLTIVYLLAGTLATTENAKTDRQRHQLSGHYLLDQDAQLSNWLGVETSTEVYLFDANARLRYRGAVDDQYGVGFSRPRPTQWFLRDALAAVDQGQAVETPVTSSPGCFVNKESPRVLNLGSTWHGEIGPLIQAKCQICHRKGQPGPFPLQTYQQVVQRKTMIRFVLENHIMPPWPTLTDHARWVNDRILLDEERQSIIDWIDAGTPAGDSSAQPTAVALKSGWQLGEPDVVLESDRELTIPASGDIPYEYVSMPTDFSDDRWVEGIEVQTAAPQNAHHILLFLLPPESNPQKFIPGIAMKTTLNRREMHALTLRGFFGGYVAGLPGVRYQAGSAKRLPKGWRILMQIHYEPNGEQRSDRPRIALYFAAQKPDHLIETRAAAALDLHIPAGIAHHFESGEHVFHKPGKIYGFFPHTHLRGTAFRYVLKDANGMEATVLDLPSYDPNWQFYYQLKEPIAVHAGATLVATGWYDNSRANPNNPNPDIDVKFGLRTRDEMMIGYFDWVEDD